MRNTWADKWHASQIARSDPEGFAPGEIDLELYERFLALREAKLIGPLLISHKGILIGRNIPGAVWAGARPVTVRELREFVSHLEREQRKAA